MLRHPSRHGLSVEMCSPVARSINFPMEMSFLSAGGFCHVRLENRHLLATFSLCSHRLTLNAAAIHSRVGQEAQDTLLGRNFAAHSKQFWSIVYKRSPASTAGKVRVLENPNQKVNVGLDTLDVNFPQRSDRFLDGGGSIRTCAYALYQKRVVGGANPGSKKTFAVVKSDSVPGWQPASTNRSSVGTKAV